MAETPDSRREPARRTVLRTAGSAGLLGAAAVIAGRSSGLGAPSSDTARDALLSGAICGLTPESIEGPFYLPDQLVRRDIREDREGVLLRLHFRVVNINTCAALANAAVDIWHCDGLGTYSGVAKRAEGERTDDSSTFLRGIQLTDTEGRCSFTTIIPGWYPGRTTHIHVKVHVRGDVEHHHYVGGHVSHTGQVFFTEKLMKVIETLPPYSDATTQRTRNDQDAYYDQAGGRSAIVRTTALVDGQPAQGYRGSMVLGVDPKARHGR